MRPVVGCWLFLFFCLARTSNVRKEVQARSATRAARATARAEESFVLLGLSMSLDLLRRARDRRRRFELPAAVAAARARAEREQAGAEEQERHRFGNRRPRRRRTADDALRRLVVAARADAGHADERDAEQGPPGEAALRRGGDQRNLAAVADRAGHVAEVNRLHLAAALRERRVGGGRGLGAVRRLLRLRGRPP